MTLSVIVVVLHEHSGQRLLEEYEERVQGEETRKDEAQEHLERASKILIDVKTGVEHLTEKLKIFKAVSMNSVYRSLLPNVR